MLMGWKSICTKSGHAAGTAPKRGVPKEESTAVPKNRALSGERSEFAALRPMDSPLHAGPPHPFVCRLPSGPVFSQKE